jgi:hypothetical protein
MHVKKLFFIRKIFKIRNTKSIAYGKRQVNILDNRLCYESPQYAGQWFPGSNISTLFSPLNYNVQD